ncbi:hypothetical protein MXF36_10105 [Pseudomonas aeruginosa]|uniref:hypothetical protein n=1 Tax=Pseudomonas aeruginosa TaxID=287 RepID=UPI002DBEF8F4|nr:hypothetical protein [Pseudomonas aeruginosa]MEB6160132.1 hypothetical protein [Pseudomonas aeruginosa]
MNTEQFIRNAAARGLSRRATMHALGIGPWVFREMLTLMPDITWPARGCSADHQRANEQKRGRCTPAPADKAIEHDRADDPIDDNTYFVMRNAGGAVFVKHGPFFRDQGGLTQDWGKGWTRIKARSIEHARQVGESLLP